MFTYNAGIMLSPLETLRFGISYRSAAHVHAKGDYTVRGNLGPMGLSQTNYGYGDLYNARNGNDHRYLGNYTMASSFGFSSMGKLEKFQRYAFLYQCK